MTVTDLVPSEQTPVETWTPHAGHDLDIQVEQTTGALDARLSEMKLLAMARGLNEVHHQTLKHHAEDCVSLGNRVLEILNKRKQANKFK